MHKYQSHLPVECTVHFELSLPMASSQASVLGSTHSVLSVLEVAKKPEMGIPEMYVRPELEPTIRSDETTPLPTIPIFDLKSLVCGNARDTELEKLYTTCKDWGFFQVYSNRHPFIYIIY